MAMFMGREVLGEVIRKGRKQFFVVLDTETATIRKANEIARKGMNPEDVAGIAKRKQSIAIAKPLVYDLGWTIVDRQGNVYKKVNYLISEIFYDQQLFETAYYANKRPIYMELIMKGEVVAVPWNTAIAELMEDMAKCDYVCAYNAAFDFKKAIPYTERYLDRYYHSAKKGEIDEKTGKQKQTFSQWEWGQEMACSRLLSGEKKGREKQPEDNQSEFLNPVFKLRDMEIPIMDLWGLACTKLINIDKYRKFCLDENHLTNTAEFFKTSAETSFQYLESQYDFIEDHTALSDAEIESRILAKYFARGGKAEPFMIAFPFKELGYTYDFVLEKAKNRVGVLIEAMEAYLETAKPSNYKTKIENKVAMLYQYR